MKFDVSTIAFMGSVAFAAQTFAVFIQYRAVTSYEGTRSWLAGTASLSLGFFLMLALNNRSVWMLSMLANPLVFAGLVLINIGIARFLGKEGKRWEWILMLVAFLAVYYYFIFIDSSIFSRSVTVAVSNAVISLRAAYALFRGKKASFAFSANFTATVFLAHGCFQVAMTALIIAMPPLASYEAISGDPLRLASFLLPIVASMLWTFGFIIMINQRLNSGNAEEREKLQMLFNISPDATLITRASDGYIADVNASFLEITGYTREEVIAKTTLEIAVWNDAGDRRAYLDELHEKGSVMNREFTFKRKGGNTFTGLVSGRAIEINDRPYVFSVVHDITERKRAEERVRSLLEEKELILKEVHHRIKNNMATINSILSLQAGTLKDPLAATALEDAGNRIKSMMTLYERLYKSSNFRELSIADYLSPLVDDILSNYPDAESIDVVKRIDDFVLDVGVLQPLGIIVNELLTNIMKYAFVDGAHGVVTISASLEGDLVTIRVADNGKGMPESVDFGTTTGFGLVLVKALTQQLRGRVEIERGQGTRFVLAFRK